MISVAHPSPTTLSHITSIIARKTSNLLILLSSVCLIDSLRVYMLIYDRYSLSFDYTLL